MADAVGQFEDLLEQERRLVLAGEIGGLERIAERKAALIRRVLTAKVGAAEVKRLRAGLDRNARLLEAAGEGIRDAALLLKQLQAGGRPLNTYDGKGRAGTIGTAGPSVSRNV